jgi:prepilin-type N-terminal cleavage/methylation domain-containing protein
MKHNGFTLVEILVALLVLCLGLASALGLVFGSTRQAQISNDRNMASLMLQEAVADIERMHLITPQEVTPTSGLTKDDIGMLVETVDIKNRQYKNVIAGAAGQVSLLAIHHDVLSDPTGAPAQQNLLVWPLSSTAKYAGGWIDPDPTNGPNGKTTENAGVAYRAIYRLEQHPDWKANPGASPFIGVYRLTLAMYRDLNPNVHPASKDKRFEQITDPMVVYLRDKKVR